MVPARHASRASGLPRKNSYQACEALRAGSSWLLCMFYTYVLKSKKDGKHYIGFTENLKKRLEEHNQGLVECTKSRIPFEIVYFEACLDKQKAIAREKYFKTGFGRSFLKMRT
jgi:putative endonuclease